VSGEYAAAVAPEIDRVRIAIAGEMRARTAEFADTGVTPPTLGTFAMLRNLPPSRRASRVGLDEVFIYQPRDATAAALAELETAGLIWSDASEVGLTAAGVAVVDRLLGISDEVVTQLWAGADLDFVRLRSIANNALRAAAADGGLAFGVVAPLYEPAGRTPAGGFAEALTPLRFHRFDAHIAAWRGAGLSLDQVQALASGDQKDAIEADTNARASTPYVALSENERDELLQALRNLPG
jgi:hypothetical protein